MCMSTHKASAVRWLLKPPSHIWATCHPGIAGHPFKKAHPKRALLYDYQLPDHSVANPGFSGGGGGSAPTHKSTIIFQFFCRKLHENERIWTRGAASLAPPLDPPMPLVHLSQDYFNKRHKPMLRDSWHHCALRHVYSRTSNRSQWLIVRRKQTLEGLFTHNVCVCVFVKC